MYALELTGTEVDILHDLVQAGMHRNMLRPCTWDDECPACDLIEKVYNVYVEWRDH